MKQLRVVILIPFITKTENFAQVSPKEAGLPWWRCLFRANTPIKKKVSTTTTSRGFRIFHELSERPEVFDLLTIPLVIYGKERAISLVVTKVKQSSYKKLLHPFIVHTAFDLGFSRERLEACSEMDAYGNITPIHAWEYGHAEKFMDLWKIAIDEQVRGLVVWLKKKTIIAKDE